MRFAKPHRSRPHRGLRSIWAGALLLAASLAGLGCTVGAVTQVDTETRQLQRTWNLEEGQILRLANLAGKVTLEAGQDGSREVLVEATIHAAGRGDGDTDELLQSLEWITHVEDGDEIWALSYPVEHFKRFHYPTRRGSRTSTSFLGEKVRVTSSRGRTTPTLFADLTITLPKAAQVELRNVVGDVRGEELEGRLGLSLGSGGVSLASFSGELRVDTGSGRLSFGTLRGTSDLDTGSGSIQVEELIGDARLDTGSGSVEIESVAASRLSVDTGSGSISVGEGSVGDLRIETGSGSVKVLGAELRTLKASTGSGSVTVRSPLMQAEDVEIDTGSGGIRIAAGPDASFDASHSSGSGSFRVRYEGAVLKRDGREVVGARHGDGRTRIRLSSGSGSAVLEPTT